jgi:hypothetical protein
MTGQGLREWLLKSEYTSGEDDGVAFYDEGSPTAFKLAWEICYNLTNQLII